MHSGYDMINTNEDGVSRRVQSRPTISLDVSRSRHGMSGRARSSLCKRGKGLAERSQSEERLANQRGTRLLWRLELPRPSSRDTHPARCASPPSYTRLTSSINHIYRRSVTMIGIILLVFSPCRRGRECLVPKQGTVADVVELRRYLQLPALVAVLAAWHYRRM